MGTIRFELRKEKIDSDGLAPIRLIYSLKGKRSYLNTKRKVYEDNWKEEDQKAVYFKKSQLLDSEIKEINRRLTKIKTTIEEIEERFESNKIKNYTGNSVIKSLLEELGENTPIDGTKTDTSKEELYAFIDRYIEDHQYTRIKGSLSVYKSLKAHLQGYEEKTRKKITFDSIDYPFFQGFQNYLVSLTKTLKDGNKVKALNNITIAKQLSTLKTFLNYAKAQGIEVSTKYSSFKIKQEGDLEVIALNRKEFELLNQLDLSKRPAWDQVRDVFIFSCATGLRFSDLNQLKWENVKEDVIDLTTIKTSHKTKIPLNFYSKAILNKYANEPRPLPVISNQRSNEHLGKICKWAGINEPVEIVRKYGAERVTTIYPKSELIRMHCGRKTFATLSLDAGMPAEFVMKIGGWKDYKSFKRYLNITDDSMKGAMVSAWGGKVIKTKLKAV